MATVLLFAIVSPAAPNASAQHERASQHSAASVLSWNQTASDAFLASAYGPPVFATAIAAVQAAVYNAVVGVKGGYEQYKWHKRAHRGTSVDAAVAAAAHDMLVKYAAAAAQPNVEAAYTAALDAIPDGWSKDAGIRFGERAAARILKLRAGDGWMDTSIVFSQPPSAGVWRPTPPAFAPYAAPWAGLMKPYLLRAHDQFRPAGSAEPGLAAVRRGRHRGEGDRVRVEHDADGAADRDRAPLRRPGQQLPAQLQWAFRDHLTRHGHGIVRAARYFAAADLSAADAIITAWDAKYVYGSWRPITAIHEADTDGNDATTADPTWAPLITTPPHPDYLSGHTTVTGSVTRALTRLTGTSRIDLNMPWLPAPVVKSRALRMGRPAQRVVDRSPHLGGYPQPHS